MTESEQLAYMTEAYASSQRESARLHATVHTLGIDLELANKRARKAEEHVTEIEKLQDDVKRLSEHVSNLQRAVLWLCQDVERSGHNLDVSRVRALVSNEVRDDGQRYRVPMNESPCEGPDEASPPPYTVHPVRIVMQASVAK